MGLGGWLKSAVTKNPVAKGVEAGAHAAERDVHAAVHAAAPVTHVVGDVAGSAAHAAGHAAATTGHAVGSAAGSAAHEVGYGVHVAAREAGHGVGTAAHETANAATTAGHAVGSAAGSAAHEVGYGVHVAAREAGHGVGTAAHVTAYGVTKAANYEAKHDPVVSGAIAGGRAAYQDAKTAAGATGHAAGVAGHAVGSAAGTAAHAVGSAADTAAHETKYGVETAGKEVGHTAGSAAHEVKYGTGVAAHEIGYGAGVAAHESKYGVETAGKAVGHAAKVQNKYDPITASAVAAGKATYSEGKAAAGAIGNAAGVAAHETKYGVVTAAAATDHAAGVAAHAVGSAAGTAAHQTKYGVETAAGATGHAAGVAAHQTGYGVSVATHETGHALGAAADFEAKYATKGAHAVVGAAKAESKYDPITAAMGAAGKTLASDLGGGKASAATKPIAKHDATAGFTGVDIAPKGIGGRNAAAGFSGSDKNPAPAHTASAVSSHAAGANNFDNHFPTSLTPSKSGKVDIPVSVHPASSGSVAAGTGALHDLPFGGLSENTKKGGNVLSGAHNLSLPHVSVEPHKADTPEPASRVTSVGGGGSPHDLPPGPTNSGVADKPAGDINRSAAFGGQGNDTPAAVTSSTPDWHDATTPTLGGFGGADLSAHGTALATRDSKDGASLIVQMSDGTYQSVNKVSGTVVGAGTWGDSHGGGVALNGLGNKPDTLAVGPVATTNPKTDPITTGYDVGGNIVQPSKPDAVSVGPVATDNPKVPASAFHPSNSAVAAMKGEDLFAAAPAPAAPVPSPVFHPSNPTVAAAKSEDTFATIPPPPSPVANKSYDVGGNMVTEVVKPSGPLPSAASGLAGLSTAPNDVHFPGHFGRFTAE